MGLEVAERLDGSEPREEAIPLLVEAHGGRLYSLGLRFCGNREEAQDLVQETFLQAFRKWHQFAGRSRPSTWLYTIASRVCQRFHRKRSAEPRRFESLDELLPFTEPLVASVPADTEGPLASELREEARARVEAAIVALPTAFRMPFVLKELVGFSVADVAAILGLQEATVKTRLHRARLRVRKAVEEALPRREVPPTVLSRQVCLDLLRAKQEALDRGSTFAFPPEIVCERCAELFATFDLAREVCREIAAGQIPEELHRRLLASIGGREGAGPLSTVAS